MIAVVGIGVAAFGGCSGGGGSADGGVDGTSGGCGTGTLCSGACVDLQSDNANCGACGTACGAGEVCSQGKCATSCGGGTKLCGSTCADTKNDPANCGGCNTKCSAGQVCSGGSCGTTCATNQTFCGGDSGTPYCANTTTDNANCGGCGVVCAAGQACQNGACTNSCASMDGGVETLCMPDAGPAYCANTLTDNANCGGCGVTCGVGEVCQSGGCVNGCAAADGGSEILCTPDAGAPYCANTQSDNDNCGGCGITCGVARVCHDGACVNGCTGADGGTETLCTPDGGSPYCANTQSDNDNCGSCGTTCGTCGSCVSGTCVGSTCCGNYTCGTALTISGTGAFYGDTCCSTSTSPGVSCGGSSTAPVELYAWKTPTSGDYYMTVSTGFAWQGMISSCGTGGDFGCGDPSSSYFFGSANLQMYFSIQATTATCGPYEFKICTTTPCTLP